MSMTFRHHTHSAPRVCITSLNKAEILQLNLIHFFASELLLMKKLEIEKTKPTFITSVLKVEY